MRSGRQLFWGEMPPPLAVLVIRYATTVPEIVTSQAAHSNLRKTAMSLPDDQCQRIQAGERPLKVWREFRGLEITDLRRATHINVGRLE